MQKREAQRLRKLTLKRLMWTTRGVHGERISYEICNLCCAAMCDDCPAGRCVNTPLENSRDQLFTDAINAVRFKAKEVKNASKVHRKNLINSANNWWKRHGKIHGLKRFTIKECEALYKEGNK